MFKRLLKSIFLRREWNRERRIREENARKMAMFLSCSTLFEKEVKLR